MRRAHGSLTGMEYIAGAHTPPTIDLHAWVLTPMRLLRLEFYYIVTSKSYNLDLPGVQMSSCHGEIYSG